MDERLPGRRFDALLDEVEAVHKNDVLPLNGPGNAMNELVGKTGPEVDARRQAAAQEMDAQLRRLDLALSHLEGTLGTLEAQIK